MQSKKKQEPSLDQLVALAQQISMLIEDNNQNMKDCLGALNQIKKHVCPKQESLWSRALQKLLNKK